MTTQKFITTDIRELTNCTDIYIKREDVLSDFHNANYETIVSSSIVYTETLKEAAAWLLDQLNSRGYTITRKGTEFNLDNLGWAIEEYNYFIEATK